MSEFDYADLLRTLNRAALEAHRPAPARPCTICGRPLTSLGISPDGAIEEFVCVESHQVFVTRAEA